MLQNQSCPKFCSKGGFTLLELLLSVAILSLIVMILGGAFRLVTRSWQKGEEEAEEFRKTRIVLDRIAEQMKSLYPYWINKDKKRMLAFQGQQHALQFVSPLSMQSPLVSGLVWVRYSLKDKGLQKGNLLVQEGMIVGNDFFPGPADKADHNGVNMVLLSEVEDLTFEYFVFPKNSSQGEWRTQWEWEKEQGKETLIFPQAIRVTLKQSSKSPKERPLVTAMTIPLPTLSDQELVTQGAANTSLFPMGEGMVAAPVNTFPGQGQPAFPPSANPPFTSPPSFSRSR
jgi:general secretion pathway protein J